MPRRLAIVLLLGGVFAGPAAAQVLLFATAALPSPTDVIDIIDLLTRKDSATSVDVRFGKTAGQGKLLVARTRVDVARQTGADPGRVPPYCPGPPASRPPP